MRISLLTVLIDSETIVQVGQNVDIPADYKQLNASGKHVYPGFMDAGI